MIRRMKLTLDEKRDLATVYFSDERQTYDGGATYLVLANDEQNPCPVSIEVQLGFEDCERLLWMTVRPASEALPAEFLATAEPVD
jgi:hypothetical protein